jgi:hypothetical protein
MAMPSGVTVGSLAFVVAAAMGLAAVSASALQDEPARPSQVNDPSALAVPSERVTTPSVPKEVRHKRRDTGRARPDAVPKVFVEVYNNSGVPGVAARKSAVLQGAGWNVAATDNWYGNIPANTVYYPAQFHDAAVKLAKVLDVHRMRPAVAPMQFDRLTVIFVSP